MIYQRPLAYLLGLEGVALLHAFAGEYDRDFTDAVNGDHTDNRLANLRILCPNCHALTNTWCARNRKPA